MRSHCTYNTPDYVPYPLPVNNCVSGKPQLILPDHYSETVTIRSGRHSTKDSTRYECDFARCFPPGESFSSFSTFAVGLKRGGDKEIGGSAAPGCLALDDLRGGNLSPRSLCPLGSTVLQSCRIGCTLLARLLIQSSFNFFFFFFFFFFF